MKYIATFNIEVEADSVASRDMLLDGIRLRLEDKPARVFFPDTGAGRGQSREARTRAREGEGAIEAEGEVVSATDLFGQPIEPMPPMNAPLPWRVYQVNNVTDWVMARTEREAIAFYLEWCDGCGDKRTEVELREAGDLNVMHELTDVELADEMFTDEEEWDEKVGKHVKRTFADELARRAAVATIPMFFASTEF